MCKTLIIESLKNNLADGVYTLRKTGRYPYAEGEFYEENIPRYDDIPNSVYHSVLACREVKKIQRCERLIVIGTSCQLRAMNTILKGKANEIIRICIFASSRRLWIRPDFSLKLWVWKSLKI